jgi:hypothetical protein
MHGKHARRVADSIFLALPEYKDTLTTQVMICNDENWNDLVSYNPQYFLFKEPQEPIGGVLKQDRFVKVFLKGYEDIILNIIFV